MHLIAKMIAVCAFAALAPASQATEPADTPFVPAAPIHKLEPRDGKFLLDGKPIQFICGEIHYNRIPRELWRDRLHRARAMGINCVSAYVFWSFHEREPGKFDFSGNADVAEFIRIAHSEGLFVYLRPGPYVCAEYDFGGYPYWLLNIPNLKWRSNDPKFIELMQRYIDALAGQLRDLQITKGGPIAFVQVENEYGSYAGDKVYLGAIRDMVKKAGFDVALTTCDGGSQMPRGYVDGCLPTINGAVGQDIFTTIDKYHKGGPYFVSEFYPAWFDVWGRPHSRKDKDVAARQFDWMLGHGASVSIYMLHGGTNFWYTNGANNPPYAPQPTSYDYDAPIGEYGNLPPKYFALRDVAAKYQYDNAKLLDAPPQPKITTVPAFDLTESAPFAAALGKPVKSPRPMSMEALNQDFGYVLYRTTIAAPVKGILKCTELRDFAVVMVDGKPVGQMDRRYEQNTVQVDIQKAPATLEILVENVGRVNYGAHLLHNNKGITQSVSIDETELLNWENYPLPLYKADVFAYPYGAPIKDAPAFHRGTFTVDEPGEIFLDTAKWGKGAMWVNGHSLGKFWAIGPQQTMYLPSCWVKKGKNEIVILELDDRGCRTTAGLPAPELNKVQKDPNASRKTVREGRDPLLDPADRIAETELASHKNPQPIVFAKPVTARHLAIEILSSHGNSDFTSLAELEVLDDKGKPLPAKAWKIWYASSEETNGESAAAERLIDGKPKTIWHSQWENGMPKPPHVVVVDMGDIQTISGIRLTQRTEDDRPGRAKQIRLYARPQFFLAKP